MIDAVQFHGSQSNQSGTRAVGQTMDRSYGLLRFTAEIGLLGMLILFPVQFMSLPLNLAPVEIWNALTMPFAWLYLICSRGTVRLPYAAAMWLVLLGSLVGMVSSPQPRDSIVAIMKDVYLYAWFVTVAALLCVLGTRTLRRVLTVWLAVGVVHGVLIIGQFLSSDIFQASLALAAGFGALDQWRPSGLFENANATALFQLMGFVPLALLRPSKLVGSLTGTVLLLSTVATGSLGATAGFMVGLSIAVVAILIASRNRASSIRALLLLAAPTLVLIGASYGVIVVSPELSARFESTFYGRAEGSAEGRFSLWDRGLEFLADGSMLWGIGPDAYRDVDLLQKPLHNDLMAFAAERGLLGLLGLLLFVAMAVKKAVGLLWIHKQHPDRAGPVVVIFLAAIGAMAVHGQFHQIFHARSVWLVMSVQEAIVLATVSLASIVTEPRRPTK